MMEGVLILSLLFLLNTVLMRSMATFIPLRKVVCLGDSNTWYPDNSITPTTDQWITLLSARRELTVINSGAPGRTSAYMLANFQSLVLDYSPHTVIIEEGANDALNWITGDQTLQNIQTMVALCRARNIVPVIMNCNPQQYSADYVSTRPSLAGKNPNWEAINYLPRARTLLANYCAETGIALIDIYRPLLNADGTQNITLNASDRVHMNAAGHMIVFNLLKKYFGLG